MYFFQLRIGNEMLQYENYLYKLWKNDYHHQKLNSEKKNR